MEERQNRRSIGSRYENVAASYLTKKGYRILEKNHRNKGGEIDILAEDPMGFLVFVEVKYRKSSAQGDPLDAVDLRKQRRICRAAVWYYMEKGYSLDKGCRFDVIAIYGDGRICHIPNAFEYH